VLHWCLSYSLTTITSNSSHLRYIPEITSQRQITVKFHGVFASHWKSLAFAPGWSIQEILVRDSGNLVTPFMQVGIQPTRYYAHFVTNSLQELDQTFLLQEKVLFTFSAQKILSNFLVTSQHRCCVRTISYKFFNLFWHIVSEDSRERLTF